MPWWGVLITVLAGLVVLWAIVWMVLAIKAFRLAKRSVSEAWKVNSPLWGAEFENRPKRRITGPSGLWDDGPNGRPRR